MIAKGKFVRIKKVILNPDQRASNIPEETKKVPLIMWTKGILLEEANLGDNVKVKTLSNRVETGELVEVNHIQKVDYGSFVEELFIVGQKAKEELFDE